MITQRYITQFKNAKTRDEALQRYRSMFIGQIKEDTNMQGLLIYREGRIEADLVEDGETDLLLLLTAPRELGETFMREIQSPAYIGQKFILDSK